MRMVAVWGMRLASYLKLKANLALGGPPEIILALQVDPHFALRVGNGLLSRFAAAGLMQQLARERARVSGRA